MAIQVVGVGSGSAAGVGLEAASPLHTTQKPIPHGAIGHFRCSTRTRLVITQAANSRIFEIRNAHASALLIPTSIRIKWLQGPTDLHTASIEDSLDVYKVTGFAVVDPTGGPVTPLTTKMRTDSGASTAQVRANALAGLAAGITAGTMTLEASPFAQLPMFLLAAPVATAVPPPKHELFYGQDMDGEHPLVLAPNEGVVVANRVLLGAAAGSSVYIDMQWVETTVY